MGNIAHPTQSAARQGLLRRSTCASLRASLKGSLMRLLFLYAHPLADSFTAAARDQAIAAARTAGHDTRLIDLYATAFAPALSAEELQSYPDPEALPAALDAHAEALLWAEGVIFLHPTWWSGPPAILTGWVQRVWRPGIAFHATQTGLRPGLPQIRLIGVITSLGAARWQWWLLGQPGRRQILRGLRACISPRARSFWLAHYAIDASTPASRAAHLAKIARRIAQIAV
jgi:NAD(P)H dehydrogenase (quinone)